MTQDQQAGKVFIGGIAWQTTLETFRDFFSQYGEIVDAVIMKDKQTQKSRGFGFVTFADPSVVDQVMEDNDAGKIVLDGRTVEAKRAIPRGSMPTGPRTKKVFVGGIAHTVTTEEFKQYFSQFGSIAEAQIMVDRQTNRSRGFGFVTFDSEDTVDQIVGQAHEIGGKVVEVKKAEPKAPRVSGPPMGSAPGGYGGYGAATAYQGSYGAPSAYTPRTPYGTPGGYAASPAPTAYSAPSYGGYSGYGSDYSRPAYPTTTPSPYAQRPPTVYPAYAAAGYSAPQQAYATSSYPPSATYLGGGYNDGTGAVGLGAVGAGFRTDRVSRAYRPY